MLRGGTTPRRWRHHSRQGELDEWANFRSTRSCSGWSGVGGQVRNAYDPSRNPSGSSAGSGVAAAASSVRGDRHRDQWLHPLTVVDQWSGGSQTTVGVVSGKEWCRFRRARTPRADVPTVADAALLAGVIAERPLGSARTATISKRSLARRAYRHLPVPRGRIRHDPAVCDARAVLEQEGAATVDLKPRRHLTRWATLNSTGCCMSSRTPSMPISRPSILAGGMQTLTDLIAFNRAHADQELIVFGQEIFEMAEQKVR